MLNRRSSNSSHEGTLRRTKQRTIAGCCHHHHQGNAAIPPQPALPSSSLRRTSPSLVAGTNKARQPHYAIAKNALSRATAAIAADEQQRLAHSAALSAFDVSRDTRLDGSSAAHRRARGSKYMYGSLHTATCQDDEEGVSFHSFRAPSEAAPPQQRRTPLLTDHGPHNVAAVHQLEYDDPLQKSEARSAYCRHGLVARHKLLVSQQRQQEEEGNSSSKGGRGSVVADDEEATRSLAARRGNGPDENGEVQRYMGCDAAAHRIAEREAEWVSHFTPYARPYEVRASGGRCGQTQHYQTTFALVQPVAVSAMYMSEEERFSRD